MTESKNSKDSTYSDKLETLCSICKNKNECNLNIIMCVNYDPDNKDDEEDITDS